MYWSIGLIERNLLRDQLNIYMMDAHTRTLSSSMKGLIYHSHWTMMEHPSLNLQIFKFGQFLFILMNYHPIYGKEFIMYSHMYIQCTSTNIPMKTAIQSSQIALPTVHVFSLNCSFTRKNMILAGLWCCGSKPPTDLFLKPIIDSMRHLSSTGTEEFWGHLPPLMQHFALAFTK